MGLKPISARFLTAGYTIALLIVAGLSVASHIALDYGLQRNEGSAAIINQTGRQRMLSQRIAGLALQYRMGDQSAHEDLKVAISAFEKSHDALILVSQTSSPHDRAAQELNALYFSGRNSLDAEVRGFVAAARRLADLSPGDPEFAQLLSYIVAEARSPLLTALDAVVSIEQRESENRIMRLESLQWAILAVVLITLAAEGIMIFRPMIRRVVAYTGELLHLAATDPLTGAANRRSFMERCEAEILRIQRNKRSACLLMLDVDRFKSVNDTYGHAAGDEVLKAVSDTLRQTLRQADAWGRLGGEEFAVLLVETPLAEAAAVAERMREQFAAMSVPHGQHRISFTVSIGATVLPMDIGGLESALQAADRLMYEAKKAGRNRVVIDTPQPAFG